MTRNALSSVAALVLVVSLTWAHPVAAVTVYSTIVRAGRKTGVPVHLLRRPSRRSIRSLVGKQIIRVPLRTSSASSASVRTSAVSSVMSSRSSDPLPAAPVQSSFLLLETASAPIAGVRFFSESEPISARKITVQLPADVPTVESILVYNENQRYLGLATHDANTLGRYSLTLPTGAFSLPYKQSISLYVRARVKPHHLGGESGQVVQVSSVSIEGTGDWSSSDYTQSSTETFPGFETARGIPTVIRNAGTSDGALVSGTSQLLGEFRFEGRKTDEETSIRLTTLRFTIESSSNVTLSTMRLQVEGSSDTHACTVSGTSVTCSSIPAIFGTFDSPRILRVYGDVTIASGALNPFLRLTLNKPGDISSSGDITWTDGEATFTWVPFEQPVARGTMMR